MEIVNSEFLQETFRSNLKKLIQQLDTTIGEYKESKRVPGLAYAFFTPKGIFYAKGWGYRNLEKSLPFTLETYNSFGSCGKAFIAMAVLKLVEKGKISLQDRIDKFVPINNLDPSNPITIHHLLSHASGIPFGLSSDKTKSWEDLYLRINNALDKNQNAPGDLFDYANCGYSLLCKIVDIVTGTDFFDYTIKNILKPLKMGHSRFILDYIAFLESGADKDNLFTIPYCNKEMDTGGTNIAIEDQFAHRRVMCVESGSLYTNCYGMINMINMLWNGGTFQNNQILSNNSINMMLDRQKFIEKPHDSKDPNRKIYYGYGWRQYDFYNDILYYHTGSAFGTGANIGFLKKSKIGFTTVTNLGGHLPHPQIVNALVTLVNDNEI